MLAPTIAATSLPTIACAVFTKIMSPFSMAFLMSSVELRCPRISLVRLLDAKYARRVCTGATA